MSDKKKMVIVVEIFMGLKLGYGHVSCLMVLCGEGCCQGKTCGFSERGVIFVGAW